MRICAWLSSSTSCGAALAAVVYVATVGAAQPAVPQPSGEANAAQPSEREQRLDKLGRPALAQLIRRRLEEVRERQTTLEAALKQVDEGADLKKIREAIDPRQGGRRGAFPRDFIEGESDAAQNRPNAGPPDRDGGPEGSGRRGDRPENDRPRGERAGPPSAEERERDLAFLREHLPRVGERLTKLAETSPDVADRLMMRMRPKLSELRDSQHDSETFKLKVRDMEAGIHIMEASRAYREAKAKKTDVEDKRAELKVAFAEGFDAQLAIQQHEAERLAKRIEMLRTDIQKRQAGRETLIDRQVDGVEKGRPPGRPQQRPGQDDRPGSTVKPEAGSDSPSPAKEDR